MKKKLHKMKQVKWTTRSERDSGVNAKYLRFYQLPADNSFLLIIESLTLVITN